MAVPYQHNTKRAASRKLSVDLGLHDGIVLAISRVMRGKNEKKLMKSSGRLNKNRCGLSVEDRAEGWAVSR